MGIRKHPQNLSARRVAESIERRREDEAKEWLERGWSVFAGQEDGRLAGWAGQRSALGLMAHFGGWRDFLAKNAELIRAQKDFDVERARKPRLDENKRPLPDFEFEETPLHIAARRGEAGFCSLLLSWGADPNRLAEDSHARSSAERAVKKTPLGLARDPGAVLALLAGGADANLCRGRSQGFAAWIEHPGWSLAHLERARELGADPLASRDEDGSLSTVRAALRHASGARLRLLQKWGAQKDDFLAAAGGVAGVARWIAEAVCERKLEALRAGKEVFDSVAWAQAWGFPLVATSSQWRLDRAIKRRKELYGDALGSVTPWMLSCLPEAGAQVASVALAAGFDPSEQMTRANGAPCSHWAAIASNERAARPSGNPQVENYAWPLWLAGQKGLDPDEMSLDGRPLGSLILSQAASAGSSPQSDRGEGMNRVMERLAKRNWAPNTILPEWKNAFMEGSSLNQEQWAVFEQAFSLAQANALGKAAKQVKAERRQKQINLGQKPTTAKKAIKRL